MITIRTIRTPDWPAIMAIQHECYHQFEPEPLEVMQNKTELAPASCWVAERQGKVLGYLLCHPWRAHQPPPLSVPMKALAGHDEFYLHDLAVSSKARGLGVGQRLLARALAFASHAGYRHAGLVRFRMPPPSGASRGLCPPTPANRWWSMVTGLSICGCPWQTAVPNREPSAEFNKKSSIKKAPFGAFFHIIESSSLELAEYQ